MRIVAAPLALEVTFAIAAARRRLVRAILGAEALHRGPSRNLRAVDREVLVRQQAAHLLVVQKFGQELGRSLRFQQPFAVLREHRRHPDRLVDPEPGNTAVQKVIVEMLHELRLGAERVERMRQQRPQQPLGWNRWPPAVGIDFGKLAIERGQHIIDDATDHAQRMRRRNTVLEINIKEQATRPLVQTPHPSLRASPWSSRTEPRPSLTVLADGRLASGSSDGTIKLWLVRS